jgi:hypothetical protein
MVKYNVQNVPEYALKIPYWVCRPIDGTLWFWGAWDDEEEAYNDVVILSMQRLRYGKFGFVFRK